MENYDKAYKYYKHNNIILSGFNSSNSHNKKNKNYKENSEFDTFYRKTTIGAVNFFFHTKMIDEIITSWSKRVDWGVMMYMDKHKYPILCLKKSNLNHIGVIGLWSKNGRYDHDENLMKVIMIMKVMMKLNKKNNYFVIILYNEHYISKTWGECLEQTKFVYWI